MGGQRVRAAGRSCFKQAAKPLVRPPETPIPEDEAGELTASDAPPEDSPSAAAQPPAELAQSTQDPDVTPVAAGTEAPAS